MKQAAYNSVAGFDDGSDTPITYKDVLKQKNQTGWWASMKKEFHAMETKGVWEIVIKSSMLPERKVVGNRCVLTENDDGTLRSRSWAQGFSHVPGTDFTGSHAPVKKDLAFRLALIIQVILKLHTGQCDINRTTFL
jgi:hypothetical protein